MEGPILLLVVLTLGGLAVARWPARVARFKEQVDAVGSERERDLSAVRSTDHNVFVVQVVGVLVSLVGVTFLLWVLFG